MFLYFLWNILATRNIKNERFYRSVGSNESPNYSKDCNLIPSDASYIKLIMGAVIDYYKPIPGKTFCEMLQSDKLHQWSSDGKNWAIPSYFTHGLGGSARLYPADGRSYLSFWGGNNYKGGCCHNSFGDKEGWKRPFNIFYGIGRMLII